MPSPRSLRLLLLRLLHLLLLLDSCLLSLCLEHLLRHGRRLFDQSGFDTAGVEERFL